MHAICKMGSLSVAGQRWRRELLPKVPHFQTLATLLWLPKLPMLPEHPLPEVDLLGARPSSAGAARVAATTGGSPGAGPSSTGAAALTPARPPNITRDEMLQLLSSMKDSKKKRGLERAFEEEKDVWLCPRCDVPDPFWHGGTFSRHVRAVHEKLRPYACARPGCGTKCSDRNGLIRHLRGAHNASEEEARVEAQASGPALMK